LRRQCCRKKPDGTGVNIDDLDRKVDPGTDFAEFANRAWHARNPIPASMDRWGRRWQAGEAAKDKLKDILESLRAQNPKGSSAREFARVREAISVQTRPSTAAQPTF
jgi:predicted metalloendopeptidase